MINSNNIQIYYWYDDNGNGHKTRTIAAMNKFNGLAATEAICDIQHGLDNIDKLENFLRELETFPFIKDKKIILWVDTNDKALLYTLLYTLVFAAAKQSIFLVLVSDTISKDEVNEVKTYFERIYHYGEKLEYVLINYGEYSELRNEKADINTIYDYPFDFYLLGLSAALMDDNLTKENTILLIPNSSNKIGKAFIQSVEKNVHEINSWLLYPYTLKVCQDMPQRELWDCMAKAKIIITTPSVTAIEASRLCNHILLIPIESNQLNTFMTLIQHANAEVYSKQNLWKKMQVVQTNSNFCGNAFVYRSRENKSLAKKVLAAFNVAF